MCVGGGCYDDNVDGGICEHLCRRVEDFRGGVVFGGIVVWLWGSLDDGVELEGWSYLDEGDVEDFCGHSAKC